MKFLKKIKRLFYPSSGETDLSDEMIKAGVIKIQQSKIGPLLPDNIEAYFKEKRLKKMQPTKKRW